MSATNSAPKATIDSSNSLTKTIQVCDEARDKIIAQAVNLGDRPPADDIANLSRIIIDCGQALHYQAENFEVAALLKERDELQAKHDDATTQLCAANDRIAFLEQREADNDLKATRQKLLDAENRIANLTRILAEINGKSFVEEALRGKPTTGERPDTVVLDEGITPTSDGFIANNKHLAAQNAEIGRLLAEANENIAALQQECDAMHEGFTEQEAQIATLTKERDEARQAATDVLIKLQGQSGRATEALFAGAEKLGDIYPEAEKDAE